VYRARGTPQEGIARLTPLLESLYHGGTSPALATLYEAMGQLLFATSQYEAALAISERAAELASAGGGDRIRALAEWNRVAILQVLGRLGEALRVSQEVLPLVERLGDLAILTVAHRDLAYIHILRGAIAAGRAHVGHALAAATQMEHPGQLAVTQAFSGWLAFLSGDWQSAQADLEQALARSGQVAQSSFAAYCLIFRASFALAKGSWADATAHTQEAITWAERSKDLQALRWASAVMAELNVLEGRAEAASARLTLLLDRPDVEECDVTALLPVLAWAQLEQGQVEQATATVEQALARARREDMRLVLVEALRVQALITLRQERWEEATRSLEEGVALARSMPYPYAEARLLHVYGRLHLQKGEPEAARERLAAAQALFGRLGAHADLDLTELALTTLPEALPGGASLQPPTALSPRHGVAAASAAGPRLSRPDRHAWALDRLREDGALSPRVYARALGVSVDTALLDLRELVGRGLVRAQGTTRDRRYLLAHDDRS
jgi:tetratricopeptide (TPR) repeat protein